MYNATRKLVIKGVDGVVFVADSLKVQKEKNVESLENLKQNLADDGIDVREIPLVMQYNKRDLSGSNIPILSVEEMERDLNRDLKVPWFPGSALKGDGVFETLREVSKRTVKHVSRKLLSASAPRRGTMNLTDEPLATVDPGDFESNIDRAIDELFVHKSGVAAPLPEEETPAIAAPGEVRPPTRRSRPLSCKGSRRAFCPWIGRSAPTISRNSSESWMRSRRSSGRIATVWRSSRWPSGSAST